MTPRLRFAPSPNGPLHLGHALSALANEAVAQREGGHWSLRIEDIDATRAQPRHEASILDDLSWLGLDWTGPVTRQSERMDLYADALTMLRGEGLLYPCYATRGAIRRALGEGAARDPDGAPLYPGLHKELAATERLALEAEGRAPAWRIDMAAALTRLGDQTLWWEEDGAGPAGETGRIRAEPTAWGDVVIARRDTPTSYHLSVVVDDAAQGITHVVRGRDLFHATSVQRLLQHFLALPAPRYLHHHLLLGEDRAKLSKSQDAPRLSLLRERGVAPSAIRAALLEPPLSGPDRPAPFFSR